MMDDYGQVRSAMSEDLANVNEGFNEEQIKALEIVCDNIIDYLKETDGLTTSEKTFFILTNYTAAKRIVRNFSKIVGVQPLRNTVGIINALIFVESDDSDLAKLDLIPYEVDIKYHDLSMKLPELSSSLSTSSLMDAEDDRAWTASRKISDIVLRKTLDDLSAIPIYKSIHPMDFITETNGIMKYLITINGAQNDIARKTHRGNGNVIIAHPAFVKLLEQTQFFESSSENIEDIQPGDLVFGGTYNKTTRVYCTYYLIDKIIIGYSSERNKEDSGYFYSPHLPVVFNRNNKGEVFLYSADATTPLNLEYYRVLEAFYPIM